MHKMDLTRLDLNLLITFDVLMRERNVTRAALVLNRSQSAISHALQRLRDQLNDPLLVKMAGTMQATPYALSLEEQVRCLLQSIEQVLTPKKDFVPGQSDRAFRVVLPDFTISLFADFCGAVHDRAPTVRLEWSLPGQSTAQDLAQGLVDVALLPGTMQRPDGVSSKNVMTLDWACGMRAGHPALQRWSLSAWENAQHAMVRMGDALHSPVARMVSQKGGNSRRIQAVVPGFSALGPLLATSNLIATLPRLVLHDLAKRHMLVLRPTPFKMAAIPFVLCWPASHAHNQGTLWLRDVLQGVLATHLSEMPGL